MVARNPSRPARLRSPRKPSAGDRRSRQSQIPVALFLPLVLTLLAALLIAGCDDDGGGVPVNAAVGVAFTDLDPDGGQIEGAATFAPPADESDVSECRLYWGQDANAKLAANDKVIDTV